MLQAQATTRARANRRLALVPTVTGIGYLALTAIVLGWGVSKTDELGRTIDYVRDGTFALILLLTIAATATLGPTLGISRRAFGLVAVGELLVFVGVLVGLVTGTSPSWFAAVGLPGNLLAFLGLALIGRHAWRTRAFPRWLAVLFFLAVPIGIGIAEFGGTIIPATLWLCVGTVARHDPAGSADERRNRPRRPRRLKDRGFAGSPSARPVVASAASPKEEQ